MRLNNLFKHRILMWNVTFLLIFSVLNTVSIESASAREPGVKGEAEIKAQRFDAAVSKLEAIEIKNAVPSILVVTSKKINIPPESF